MYTTDNKILGDHGVGYKSEVHGMTHLNVAKGAGSIASGIGTVATADGSNARGQWNVEDTEGQYIDIVGNGTDEENRSNAYTLDAEGNAHFAGSVTADGGFVGEGSGGGGADWNAQEGEDGYIANKPFYAEYGIGDTIFEETTASLTLKDCTTLGDEFASWSGWYLGQGSLSEGLTKYPFTAGDTVKATIDGQEYTLVAVADIVTSGSYILGFAPYFDPAVSTPDDLSYLFSLNTARSQTTGGTNDQVPRCSLSLMIFTQDSTKSSVTVKLEEVAATYHKIDPVYIPPEGSDTTASGNYSHAEGIGTTASGDASHAEGSGAIASGECSHAEGAATKAYGECSHAEGSGGKASGDCSHAEGSGTTASGDCSHAEGNATTASVRNSHAEGCGTKASGDCQHVEGKYNIEDTNGEYAHIVGNGTSKNNVSNAYTLDWSGNGIYSGTLTCATSFTIGSTTITEAQLTALLATLG